MQETVEAEVMTLAQAVHEANGKMSYQQLWRAIRAGRVAAYQPSGERGKYAISRTELKRILEPRRTK